MSALGKVLVGFSDFFDEVGAVKKPGAKPTGKPAPKGPKGKYAKPYAKPSATKVVQHHGKVLAKAKGTLLKAAKLVGHSQVALAHKPVAPSARTPAGKPIAGRRVLLGAAAVAVLSPKAKAAVQKHNVAVAKAKQAAQTLAQHAIKTKKAVGVLAKHVVNQKKISKKLRTPLSKRPGVHIGSILTDPTLPPEGVQEALEDYYTLVGAAPDPSNPGFLDDGSPDPAFAAAGPTAAPAGAPADASSADVSAALSDAGAGDAVVDSGTDLPPPPGMDVFITDMNAVGGIAYDGSKGKPNGFVGSYGLFTKSTRQDAPGGPVAGSDPGMNDYGYVWGSFDQDTVVNGIPWGGRLTENAWNEVFGRYVRGMPGEFNHPVSDSEAFASNTKTAPNNAPYGPLVGNPGMPDFKGMRVDAAGNMFWLPQEAPDWLTFPLKQAAALTAQAEKKAADEAAKAAAAAAAKAAADAAAAQAAQDAANALAESQAASQAKIAQQEEATKQAAETTAQAQQETAAQQQIVSQAKAEQEQAAQQAAQEAQASDILIQRAKRQEAYFAEHPELEVALQAQAQGLLPEEGEEEGAPEEGGDEGAADEGGGDEGSFGTGFDTDQSAEIDYYSEG